MLHAQGQTNRHLSSDSSLFARISSVVPQFLSKYVDVDVYDGVSDLRMSNKSDICK
jgi:hypothetical protein